MAAVANYRRGDGIQALLDLHLAIAARQDPHHCAACGTHLDRWYYGFPFPLCARCVGHRTGPARLSCPWPTPRPCQRCPSFDHKPEES